MATNTEPQNGQSLVKPQEASPTQALSRYLDARLKNLAKFCAARVKPETLVRLAIFEFSQNEWLRRCTPESIYGSLILSAQMGLEPGGLRGLAYLVPYKGKCTLIPGWRGLVHLALKSKAVKSIQPYLVYEADHFKVWLGTSPRIEHEPSLDADRGRIIAAYAVAHLENGMTDQEVMPIEELVRIRDMAAKSRGGKDGPAYQEWEGEMYRKAPVRRLCKRLPLGEDFQVAARADELAEAGEIEKINSFIEADATERVEQSPISDAVADRLAQRARDVNA